MLLKSEALAGVVCRCGVRMSQHFAKVYEVTLRSGVLAQCACFPALDKFHQGECQGTLGCSYGTFTEARRLGGP